MYRRRELLRKITEELGLGDAYGAVGVRIKAQSGGKSPLGMEALMWTGSNQLCDRSTLLSKCLFPPLPMFPADLT